MASPGMFQSASNVNIGGGSFLVVDGNYTHHQADPGVSGIDILRQHIALTALHNSKARSSAPKCYPDTRVDVLKAIMDWISNPDSLNGGVLWLHGPLGSGKSAIAQTIAERISQKRNRKLAASFFFSNTTSDRNTEDHLVATIAHQLAQSIPGVTAALDHSVKENPSIVSSSLEDQIECLVTEPLLQAVQNLGLDGWPDIVIIDGINGCSGEAAQHDIIRAFSTAIREHELPLRLIITSRPEKHIRNFFNRGEIKTISKSISLDDPAFETKKDVDHYLRSELARIREENLPDAAWPAEQDTIALLEKSPGQFLYPALAIEFIDNPQRKPEEQLKILLRIPVLYGKPTSPFAEFDRVYVILGAVHVNHVITEETLSRPYLHCAHNILPPDNIEEVFRYLNTLSTGSIRALLQDVHSVLSLHTYRT